jgi:Transposase DDE domain
MEENHDHWNGDHCVDPHVVRGVIFCNQALSNFPAPTFRPKFLGTAKKILGLVTDAPQLSAADVIRAYDKRWTVEQWLKDVKQLLGLSKYQNRSYWAAVTHLHLVCFAYAPPDPPAHRANRCTRPTDTS